MYRVSSRVHTVLVTLRLALMIQVPAQPQGARSDLRSLHTDLRLFLFALSVILLVSCVVNVRSGELTQTTRRVAAFLVRIPLRFRVKCVAWRVS